MRNSEILQVQVSHSKEDKLHDIANTIEICSKLSEGNLDKKRQIGLESLDMLYVKPVHKKLSPIRVCSCSRIEAQFS